MAGRDRPVPFPRRRSVALAWAGSGFFSIVAQVALVREIFFFFSGSETCFGVVLAAWLLWTGIGAALGGWLARRASSERVFVRSALAAIALFPLTVLLVRVLRPMMGMPTGEAVPFRLVAAASAAVLGPLGLALGAQLGSAPGLGSTERRSAAGRVYAAETAGSAVGSILLTFALLGRVPGSLLPFAAAVPALAVLSWLRQSRALVVGSLLAALPLLPPVAGPFTEAMERLRWRSLSPRLSPLEWVEGRYGSLAVVEWAGGAFLFGSGMIETPIPELPGVQPFVHLAMAESPYPRRVLVLGGAAAGVLGEVLAHGPDEVRYVDPDPERVGMAERHLPPDLAAALADPRVEVIGADGRAYVAGLGSSPADGDRFDVVLSSLPDPATAAANRYYTTGFFEEVRAVLDENGIFAFSLASSRDYFGDALGDLDGSVYGATRAVFPATLVAPGERAIVLAGARKGLLTDDPDVLARRLSERGVAAEFFPPELIAQVLEPERVAFARDELEAAAARTPPNTDLRPISYLHQFRLWRKIVGSAGTEGQGAEGAGAAAGAGGLAAVLLVAVFVRVRRRPPAGLPEIVAAGAIGLVGMGASLVAILFYQVAFGSLYSEVGLVVAAFMVGMSAGSSLGNRLAADAAGREAAWLRVSLLALGLACLILPPAIRGLLALRSRVAFLGVTALAGGLAGAAFAAVAGSSRARIGEDGVGRLFAADLAGACAGAILVGSFGLAWLGLSATCAALAAVSLAPVLLFAVVGRRIPPNLRRIGTRARTAHCVVRSFLVPSQERGAPLDSHGARGTRGCQWNRQQGARRRLRASPLSQGVPRVAGSTTGPSSPPALFRS